MESFAVIELSLGILRKHFSHLRSPLEGRYDPADELGRTERTKGNHQRRPSNTMPCPSWPKARRGQRGWPRSLDSQHGPRLRLTDFPNKSVVIKMKQGRGGNEADQDVSHRFHRNSRLGEAERPV